MKYKYNNQWNDLKIKVSDTLPIGSIVEYGGTTAPTNWLICDGSAVSRTTYSELFAAIGTTYGSGDGETTFNLPDLRGKVPVGKHADDTSFDVLGETGGEKTHQLSVDEMPQHSHNFVGSEGSSYDDAYVNFHGSAYPNNPAFYKGATYSSSGVFRLDGTGGSQSHNNLQPYLVLNYIIKAYQSAVAATGEVYNTSSDSTVDTYSCDYINKFGTGIYVYPSTDFTIEKNGVYTLTLDATEFKTNDNLTLSNNKIIIGAGIHTILIIGQWTAWDPTSEDRYIYVQKNSNAIGFNADRYSTTNSTCVVTTVQENDAISLHAYQNEVNALSIKGEKERTFLQVIVLN